MKIKELIKKLETLDPELHIFVDGYEGGFSDIIISDTVKIALNVNEEYYYGDHELASRLDNNKNKYEIVEAVILKRK